MGRSRSALQESNRSPSTSAAAMQTAVDGTKRPPLREEDPSGEYFRAERRRGASPARHEPQSKRERRRGASPARHEPQSKRERGGEPCETQTAVEGAREREPGALRLRPQRCKSQSMERSGLRSGRKIPRGSTSALSGGGGRALRDTHRSRSVSGGEGRALRDTSRSRSGSGGASPARHKLQSKALGNASPEPFDFGRNDANRSRWNEAASAQGGRSLGGVLPR